MPRSVTSDEFRWGIGSRIRWCRKKRGWKLREVRDRTDLSIVFLSKLENGKTSIGIGTLLRLSNVFGVTIDWLVKGDA